MTTKFDPFEIYSIFDFDEDYDLEFKSAKGGLPRSLWQTYSAFANSNPGVILLGVKNDGTIEGLDVKLLSQFRKNLWDSLNDRGKVSINLIKEDDIREVVCGSQKILAIRVPKASRYQCPVYLNQSPLTETYRRNYEGDYRCTEQEVRSMFSDQMTESVDSKIITGFTLNDLDHRSLREYRNRFASFKPEHPWLSEDDKGLLTKLGGWRKDKNSNLEGITLAAILMFGTDESIREASPQYQINYYEKLSNNPQVRWTDRITVDGTWTANLFQFYLRTIQRLTQDLKTPFQLDKNLIRKDETPVHEAIREALVNSIIHADYFGQGGIKIEKKSDRFEFSNPGSLLVPKNTLIFQRLRSGISECRNKILQQMFMMIGAAEKAGSGIDKIYYGWESQLWRQPFVEEFFQPMRVTWSLPMTSLIPDESISRLKKDFGQKFDKLNPLEVQILVTADLEGRVDNRRISQISNKHTSDLTKLLQSLVAQGMLLQNNKARWSYYTLNDNYSVHNEDYSVHNEDHSVHKKNHSVHNFAPEEWKKLETLANQARTNKRLNPDLMEEIIKNLCKNRWITRRQLADLLDRNPDSLRTRFLTSMVKHQIIKLRYPNNPNRIDQAYQTNDLND